MSEKEDPLDLALWPSVPSEDRPRKLYVNYGVPDEVEEALDDLGWTVTDVRLMEGPDAALATLEGASAGSITLTPNRLKCIEAEVKVRKDMESRHTDEETIEGFDLEKLWKYNKRIDINKPAYEPKEK